MKIRKWCASLCLLVSIVLYCTSAMAKTPNINPNSFTGIQGLKVTMDPMTDSAEVVPDKDEKDMFVELSPSARLCFYFRFAGLNVEKYFSEITAQDEVPSYIYLPTFVVFAYGDNKYLEPTSIIFSVDGKRYTFKLKNLEQQAYAFDEYSGGLSQLDYGSCLIDSKAFGLLKAIRKTEKTVNVRLECKEEDYDFILSKGQKDAIATLSMACDTVLTGWNEWHDAFVDALAERTGSRIIIY